jgi:hypothetical protein
MDADAPIRQRVPHSILITIIHPRNDEDPLVGKGLLRVVARITEQFPRGFGVKCQGEDMRCGIKSI